jgi:hypothetical protein
MDLPAGEISHDIAARALPSSFPQLSIRVGNRNYSVNRFGNAPIDR